MSFYPQLPDYPPKPILPIPTDINRARRRDRTAPPGSVRAGDGKVVPIVYGKQYIKPYIGSVLYGKAEAALQSQDAIGMSWIYCLGPINRYEYVYLNDNTYFSVWFNELHGDQKYVSEGAYNYFSLTSYLGQDDQVPDPGLAAMNMVTTNFSESYTDANIHTDNGIAVGQAYMATVQTKLYDKELLVPSAIVEGLLCYDPRGPVTQYTENPALHLADFLSADYGANLFANWTSVGDAADYCDELIDGKKRNRGGFIINAQSSLDDIIERMRALAGVRVIKTGSQFHFVVDKPGTSVFTFDSSNIVKGSVDLAYRPLLDKPSQIEVEYTKAKRNDTHIKPPWLSATVVYPGSGDPGYSASIDERRVARVEFLDCQDIDVALRFAKKMWFRQQDSVWRLRFETKDMAAALYDGELVTVQHPLLPGGGAAKLFLIRRISARHTHTDLTYAVELEEYAPTSYVDDPQSETGPSADLSEPAGGASGSTVLPLYSTVKIAENYSQLVNIEQAPDDYCILADAVLGIRAEGYVLKGEGEELAADGVTYIVQVNVNEGLMESLAGLTKGRVFLGESGAVVMAPPANAIITQDVGTAEPPVRALFHYSDPEIGRWRGVQAGAGPWYPGEMVQDDGWLMRCLTTTTDPAAPQPIGDVDWIVPDDETFVNYTHAGRVFCGHLYDFDSLVSIEGQRLQVPYDDIEYTISFWIADDPADLKLICSLVVAAGLTAGQRAELPLANSLLINPGTTLCLSVDYDRQTAASSFTFNWDFIGDMPTPGDPGTGNVGRDAHDRLFISKTDAAATDRSSSLATLVSGDDITITETADSTRYLAYQIVGTPVDFAAYVECPVDLKSSGNTVRDKTVQVFGEHYSVAANADVPRDVDYWLTHQFGTLIQGFLVTKQADIPGALDKNLYPVDFKGTILEASIAWDFMAYSGDAAVSGGSSGMVRSVNSSLPDAGGNVEFARLGIGVASPFQALHIAADSTPTIRVVATDDSGTEIDTDAPRIGAAQRLFSINTAWQGNIVVSQRFLTGSDTVGFSDGRWVLQTATGGTLQEGLRVQSQRVGIGGITPTATLHVDGSSADQVQTQIEANPSQTEDIVRVLDGAGSEAFVVTNPGNVGIGTNAPSGKLHVNDGGTPFSAFQSAAYLTALVLQNDNVIGDSCGLLVLGSNTGTSQVSLGRTSSEFAGRIIYDHSIDQMKLETNNINAVFIDSSQRVGVVDGTDPTLTAKFHVINTSTDDSFRIDDVASDSTPFIVDNAGKVGIGATTPLGTLHLQGQTDQVHLIAQGVAGQTENIIEARDSAGAEQVVVTAEGNVGINVNQPDNPLHVGGGVAVSGPITQATAGSLLLDFTGGRATLTACGPGPINDYGDLSIRSATSTGSAQYVGMFIQGSDSKVGINTLAPEARLHVQGTPVAEPVLKVTHAGFAADNALDVVNFADAGLLSVTKDGEVGVGTKTPQAKLDVYDNGTSKNTLHSIVSDDETVWHFNLQNLVYDSSVKRGMRFIVRNDGEGRIFAPDNGTSAAWLSFFTDEQRRVRINALGDVGIGSSGPSAKLHVYGQADKVQFRVDADAAQTANIVEVQDSAGTDLVVVDSAGKVGIGATNPVQLMHINGPATPTIRMTSTDDTGLEIDADANRTAAAQKLFSITSAWNGTIVADVRFLTGADTTNKDDGRISFRTAEASGTLVEQMRIQAGRVGIGTSSPDPSTILDVTSTTGGIAPPRMTTTQRDAISTPTNIMIFNTTTNKFQGHNGTSWVDFH